MMARGTRRRTQGRAERFSAPWGRAVKLITALVVTSIMVGLVVPQLAFSGKPGEALARWLVPAVILLVFGVTSLFSVRGFTVNSRELLVQRTFWQTRFSLSETRQVRPDPAAMKGSIRIAGNGGFLAYTGRFRNRKLGSYRAFVTDPARCVVVEFKDRKIVVSPDDPQRFVNALGFESDMQGRRSDG